MVHEQPADPQSYLRLVASVLGVREELQCFPSWRTSNPDLQQYHKKMTPRSRLSSFFFLCLLYPTVAALGSNSLFATCCVKDVWELHENEIVILLSLEFVISLLSLVCFFPCSFSPILQLFAG